MMLLGSVLYAKDMTRLAGFYQLLGFEIQQQADDFTVLSMGQSELSIVQTPPAIEQQIVIADPPLARTETPIKLVFVADSIEEMARRLSAHGARTDRGQARWEMGVYFVQDGVDPEGNIFQLRELKPDQ